MVPRNKVFSINERALRNTFASPHAQCENMQIATLIKANAPRAWLTQPRAAPPSSRPWSTEEENGEEHPRESRQPGTESHTSDKIDMT